MTSASRSSLREFAEKATPGPWLTNVYFECVQTHNTHELSAVCYRGRCDKSEANLDYIAAANPATILAMLDRLDKLEKVAEAASDVVHDHIGAAESGADISDNLHKLDEALSALERGEA